MTPQGETRDGGRICFGCSQVNAAENIFCSTCGSPLKLASYVDRQVSEKLAEVTRDRDLVETESSIRVFERAYGWAKLVGGIATGLVAILIAGAAWESFNIRTTVSSTLTAVGAARTSAEKQISETASNTLSAIARDSALSEQSIQASVRQANKSSAEAQKVAFAQRTALAIQATSVRRDFQNQASAVTKDVTSARQQIQAASQLQPQMASLQEQLGKAQSQIREQQKVLTSSADFVKQIFASRVQIFFDKKTATPTSFAILDGTKTDGIESVVLYFLIPNTPIQGTLELQFNQTPSAPGSFFVFHNMMVTYIQKPALGVLLDKPVAVSYFPDPDDKNQIKALSVRDGRVYADDEALPKFGVPDDSFKGSKWFPAAPPIQEVAPTPTPAPK